MPVTREGRGAGGCFKLGCLGCLVIVGLPVLFVMGLLLLNVFTGHEEVRPESRELARELPPLEQGQIPEEMTEPGPEVVERLRRLTSSQAVTVMLDVSELQFRLEPGPAGEPIRVEADFDTGSYELSESMEEDDELGSVYHLRFAPKRPWWLRLLRRHDVQNEVRLILPRDVPLALAGNIGFGESRMELEGLWIVDVDLKARAGEHTLRISDPLREPLESFHWESSYGEIEISGLGNASARQTSVSHKAGEFRLDLEGEWQNDTEVEAYLGFGELTVQLPDDMRVDVERAGVTFGTTDVGDLPRDDELPEDARTIQLSIGGIAGEHRVSP